MDGNQTKKQLLDKWLSEQSKLKSRARRRKYIPPDEGVTINSLMDAVTIILIFLLMNFSTDPMKITQSEDLRLPPSTTTLSAKEVTITLTISANKILVNDEEVVQITNNDVETGSTPQIDRLKRHLDEVVEQTKQLNQRTGEQFKDILTVVAHADTQYKLLSKVIYTAGLATFTKFRFAVTKGGQMVQAL